MIKKFAKKIADFIRSDLHIEEAVERAVAARKNECYTVSETFDKVSDLTLSAEEKAFLKKLAGDEKMFSILDKHIYSQSVNSINASSALQIAEMRGAVKALQHLRSEVLKQAPKKVTNQLTQE